MIRQLSVCFGATVLATMVVLTPADAHGPGGGGGHGGGPHAGYHGNGVHYGGFYYPHHGYGFYGPYRPGLYGPYGFYRPYYGRALAFNNLGLFGLGLGMGYGLGGYGLGGYGLGGYGLGGYGSYRPYYGGAAIVAPTVVMPPAGVGGTGGAPMNQTPPPPDNAAHLQLVVPQNAEVLFNGDTTTQTGTVREFVSPPLTPGKSYDYAITVRRLDADGKSLSDRRVIHVHANDWFRIDFTRPAPPEPLPQP